MLSSKEKTLINVRQITSNGSLKDIRRKCNRVSELCYHTGVGQNPKASPGNKLLWAESKWWNQKTFFPHKKPQTTTTHTNTHTHTPSWYNYQSTQISKLKRLYMNGQTNFFKKPKYCSNKGSSCIIWGFTENCGGKTKKRNPSYWTDIFTCLWNKNVWDYTQLRIRSSLEDDSSVS